MTYLGFDIDGYPGDDAMRAMRGAGFDFCGFYLPGAPSHRDRGWSGKRAFLQDELGFGLIVVFVAQETVGPGSHIVTAPQGLLDGQQCVALMQAEGFPARSRPFQDLENGPPFSQAELAYVSATQGAVGAGGYVPSVYCSHLLAAQIDDDLAGKGEPGSPAVWGVRVPTTARTSASLPIAAPAPGGCGFPEAVAWQFRQNVAISVGGFDLVVDLNSALDRDPSAPT